MKKLLLIIFILLTVQVCFASFNLQATNFLTDENPQDTNIVNLYDLQKIKLYPNPASNYLNIDYDILFIKEAKIQIYNSIGSVVYSKMLKNKQDKMKVSISDFDDGLYFCSLLIDGKLFNTKKVLINHH